MKRTHAHQAMKQVVRNHEEFQELLAALVHRSDSSLVRELGVSTDQFRFLRDQLYELYFVRLFAEFESILRNYWKNGLKKATSPLTKQLIDSIASRHHIPSDTLDAAQEIRDFRNKLVHEDHDNRKRFAFDDASRHLNAFLSRLPEQW